MECTDCRSLVDDRHKFCGSCGAAVTGQCPHCQAAVPRRFKHCTECGKPMNDSMPLTDNGATQYPQHHIKPAKEIPFIFILGPGDDCTSDDYTDSYTEWLENKLVPALQAKNVLYKSTDHFEPGSKQQQLTNMLMSCTYIIVPICEAVCTKLHSILIGEIKRKDLVPLELPKEIAGTKTTDWCGLNTFQSYRCRTDADLQRTVDKISKFSSLCNYLPQQLVHSTSLTESQSDQSVRSRKSRTSERNSKVSIPIEGGVEGSSANDQMSTSVNLRLNHHRNKSESSSTTKVPSRSSSFKTFSSQNKLPVNEPMHHSGSSPSVRSSQQAVDSGIASLRLEDAFSDTSSDYQGNKTSGSQPSRKTPYNSDSGSTTQNGHLRPGPSSQLLRPGSSSQGVQLRPGPSPQGVQSQPGSSPQGVPLRSSPSSQGVQFQSGSVSQGVQLQPSSSLQGVQFQPGSVSQGVPIRQKPQFTLQHEEMDGSFLQSVNDRIYSMLTESMSATTSSDDKIPSIEQDFISPVGFVQIPAHFRHVKVNIYEEVDRSTPMLSTHSTANLQESMLDVGATQYNRELLDIIYDAKSGNIKNILKNEDSSTMIRYIIPSASHMSRNEPRYLVSLTLIAKYTNCIDTKACALTFLAKSLTSVSNLNVETMAEIKSLFSKIISKAEDTGKTPDQEWSVNLNVQIITLLFKVCRLASMFLLVNALSGGTDIGESKIFLQQISFTIILAKSWRDKGYYGSDQVEITCQKSFLEDVQQSLQSFINASPQHREKLQGILDRIINFSTDNKTSVKSFLKDMKLAESLSVLLCVSSLATRPGGKNTSENTEKYYKLMEIVHNSIISSKKHRDTTLMVLLKCIVTTAEKIKGDGLALTTMNGLLSSTITKCRGHSRGEYFERNMVPLVSNLLYHSYAPLRDSIARMILPYNDNRRTNERAILLPRSHDLLISFNAQCIQRDMIQYRVFDLKPTDNEIPTYLKQCTVYKGTFGKWKHGEVEVICLKQTHVTDFTQQDISQEYRRIHSRLDILQNLQSQEKQGIFGDIKHIVTLIAYMFHGNGICYYFLKSGSVPQSLSKYLHQKLLSEPPKQIPLMKRMQYAIEMVSAISYCNGSGILVRNITTSAFIICKEDYHDEHRMVKLYNLELAKQAPTVGFVYGEKDGPGEAVPTLWLAPESLYKAQYSQSTEVYTLAHALLEVLSYGVHPYQEMGNVSTAQKITTILKYRVLPERRPCIPEAIYIGLLACFLKDAQRRGIVMGLHTLLNSYTISSNRQSRVHTGDLYLRSLADLLKSQPREPKTGIPSDVQHIQHENDFRPTEMEEDYNNYIAGLQNRCTVNERELFCHDYPVPQKDQPYLINLCMIRRHTPEEKTTLRDICVGKDASQFVALVKRFIEKTPRCSKHNAMTINIGRNRKPLIDIILDKRLDPSQRLSTYTQIAKGIKFLHDHELIHCSLQAKYVYASVSQDNTISVVIGQLNRTTKLERDLHDNDISEAFAKPYDVIPGDILRWCPLETHETGFMSMYSDVAMFGHTVWEIESCNGLGADVPRKILVPYPHLCPEQIPDALRQRQMLPQPQGCEPWIDRLIKVCTVNPKCRRPLFDEIISVLQSGRPQDHPILNLNTRKLKRGQGDSMSKIYDEAPTRAKKGRLDIAKVVSHEYDNEEDHFYERGTLQDQRKHGGEISNFYIETVKRQDEKRPVAWDKIKSFIGGLGQKKHRLLSASSESSLPGIVHHIYDEVEQSSSPVSAQTLYPSNQNTSLNVPQPQTSTAIAANIQDPVTEQSKCGSNPTYDSESCMEEDLISHNWTFDACETETGYEDTSWNQSHHGYGGNQLECLEGAVGGYDDNHGNRDNPLEYLEGAVDGYDDTYIPIARTLQEKLVRRGVLLKKRGDNDYDDVCYV